jgi:hypothetical protein
MLFPWTTPTNWTTIVGFDVNRNAAFCESSRLGQSNAAIDFVAVSILRHGGFVVEVSGAKAFVAIVLRVHSLAFEVSFSLERTSRELVDVII